MANLSLIRWINKWKGKGANVTMFSTQFKRDQWNEWVLELGTTARCLSSHSREAGVGGSLQVGGQPGLHREVYTDWKTKEKQKSWKHNCLSLTIEENLRCTTWDFMNTVELLTDTEDTGVHTQLLWCLQMSHLGQDTFHLWLLLGRTLLIGHQLL